MRAHDPQTEPDLVEPDLIELDATPGEAEPTVRPAGGGPPPRLLDLLGAFVLGLVLFLPGIGPERTLWNPDEPRFGEIAREMLAEGEWATPLLNGAPYSNKTPLYFWAEVAAARALGRMDETAARLPSVLAGAGAVALTLVLGTRLGGTRRTGWLAALVFGSTFKVYWQSGVAQLDMLLTFWVLVAIVGYERTARLGRADLPAFLMLYGGAAVATLAKGLAGLVVPGLVAFADVLRRGAWRDLLRYRLPTGTLLYLAIAAPWFVRMGLTHGAPFLENLIVRQHFTRFTDAFDHAHGPFYLVGMFPLEFVPWTLALPAVVLWLVHDREDRTRLGLALGWFVAVLAFFSVSGSKRGLYLLPLYPAAAIVVGTLLDRWLEGDLDEAAAWALETPLVALPYVAAAGAIVAPVVTGLVSPADAGTALAAGLAIAPVAALVAAIARFDRGTLALGTVLLAVVVHHTTRTVVLPGVDERYKSPKPFVEAVRTARGPDAELAAYEFWRGYFNFYLSEPRIPFLTDPTEAVAFLRGRPKACLIVRTKKLPDLEAVDGRPLEPVVVKQIGSKEVALVCAENEAATSDAAPPPLASSELPEDGD